MGLDPRVEVGALEEQHSLEAVMRDVADPAVQRRAREAKVLGGIVGAHPRGIGPAHFAEAVDEPLSDAIGDRVEERAWDWHRLIGLVHRRTVREVVSTAVGEGCQGLKAGRDGRRCCCVVG